MTTTKPILTNKIDRPELKWDATVSAGYLTLADGRAFSTKQVAPNVNLDYDLFGNVIGIEIL